MSGNPRYRASRLVMCGVADATRRANQVIDFSSEISRIWPNGANEGLRQKTDFPMRFNLMGHFKPSLENNQLPFFGKLWLSAPIPPPPEGRFAIVTSVGSGLRWT
jgi:hypothetical protein